MDVSIFELLGKFYIRNKEWEDQIKIIYEKAVQKTGLSASDLKNELLCEKENKRNEYKQLTNRYSGAYYKLCEGINVALDLYDVFDIENLEIINDNKTTSHFNQLEFIAECGEKINGPKAIDRNLVCSLFLFVANENKTPVFKMYEELKYKVKKYEERLNLPPDNPKHLSRVEFEKATLNAQTAIQLCSLLTGKTKKK